MAKGFPAAFDVFAMLAVARDQHLQAATPAGPCVMVSAHGVRHPSSSYCLPLYVRVRAFAGCPETVPDLTATRLCL